MRVLKVIGLALLLCLLLASPSLAHRVNLFAYVEGGTIYTESYFSDGRPVKQGRVEVRDAADQILIAGSTDSEGLYDCPIPQVSDLTIKIIASMGHRNIFKLKKAEIEDGQ